MKSSLRDVDNTGRLSLEESETRYRRLFEAAQDGILILDAGTGAITDVNPFLINLLGYTRDEFMHKKLWEVGAFKDINASKEAFRALQKNEYIQYKDLPLKTIDGKLIQVEFVSNVYNAGGKKVIQCNIRDITQRKMVQDALLESEANLRELSVRDHLTGLFNRRYMEETLERELLRATRKNFQLGLIMLDVDGFKGFNDTYGHAAGDSILRELSKMIISHVRGDDVPSRFGGDEFLIILPDATRLVTRERAKRLSMDAQHINFQFEGQNLGPLTLSLGVAGFPENGPDSESLLKAVDGALYHAKREGGSRVVVATSKSHRLDTPQNPSKVRRSDPGN